MGSQEYNFQVEIETKYFIKLSVPNAYLQTKKDEIEENYISIGGHYDILRELGLPLNLDLESFVQEIVFADLEEMAAEDPKVGFFSGYNIDSIDSLEVKDDNLLISLTASEID